MATRCTQNLLRCGWTNSQDQTNTAAATQRPGTGGGVSSQEGTEGAPQLRGSPAADAIPHCLWQGDHVGGLSAQLFKNRGREEEETERRKVGRQEERKGGREGTRRKRGRRGGLERKTDMKQRKRNKMERTQRIGRKEEVRKERNEEKEKKPEGKKKTGRKRKTKNRR